MAEDTHTEKRAPVQGYPAGIPWWLHMEAYAAYSRKYRPQQALIEGGCRGGFHVNELDDFVPGWRDRIETFGMMRSALIDFVAAADSGHVSVEVDRAARAAIARATGEA